MIVSNRTRLKRLRQLHHMLSNHDKLFKKVEFNMDFWINKDEMDIQNKNCNTAACALGSACLYEPFIKQGLQFEKGNYQYPDPEFEGETDFQAGAKFFGISLEESDYLFDPSEYSYEENVKPCEVADRVCELIGKYKKRKKNA